MPRTPAATCADSEEEEEEEDVAASVDEGITDVGDEDWAASVSVLGRPVVPDGAEVCNVGDERRIDVVNVTVVVGPGRGTMGAGLGVVISTDGSVPVELVDGLGAGGGDAAVNGTGTVDQPLVSVEAEMVVNGPVFQALESVESEKVVIILCRR